MPLRDLRRAHLRRIRGGGRGRRHGNRTLRSATPMVWANPTRRWARARSTRPGIRPSRVWWALSRTSWGHSTANTTASASFGSDQEETNRKESPQESQEEPGGETAGLTGPMAIGVDDRTRRSRGAVGRGGQQQLRLRRGNRPEERNEPEVTVSHSPATEPSQEPCSAPAADRDLRPPTILPPRSRRRSSRPRTTWPSVEDPPRRLRPNGRS